MNILKDGITLSQAAGHCGKRYEFVRALIYSGRLRAFRDGGSDRKPRLLVLPAELDEAVNAACLFVPPGLAGESSHPGRRKKVAAHPDRRF